MVATLLLGTRIRVSVADISIAKEAPGGIQAVALDTPVTRSMLARFKLGVNGRTVAYAAQLHGG